MSEVGHNLRYMLKMAKPIVNFKNVNECNTGFLFLEEALMKEFSRSPKLMLGRAFGPINPYCSRIIIELEGPNSFRWFACIRIHLGGKRKER